MYRMTLIASKVKFIFLFRHTLLQVLPFLLVLVLTPSTLLITLISGSSHCGRPLSQSVVTVGLITTFTLCPHLLHLLPLLTYCLSRLVCVCVGWGGCHVLDYGQSTSLYTFSFSSIFFFFFAGMVFFLAGTCLPFFFFRCFSHAFFCTPPPRPPASPPSPLPPFTTRSVLAMFSTAGPAFCARVHVCCMCICVCMCVCACVCV